MGSVLHPLLEKEGLKWVFLDLDNTLWDFDANAREALKELYHRHSLHLHCDWHVDAFISLYQDVNAAYWKRYEKGEVDKETLRTARFYDTFNQMGIPSALQPTNIWQEYLEICPIMKVLMPGAFDAVKRIHEKYKIAILTNGFEKTQALKLYANGLEPMVDLVVSSEALGLAKPNVKFFEEALRLAQVSANEVIYVGDNWQTDVKGGLSAGIVTFWYQSDLIQELMQIEDSDEQLAFMEDDNVETEAMMEELQLAREAGVLLSLVNEDDGDVDMIQLTDYYGGAVGDWSKFSTWLCD